VLDWLQIGQHLSKVLNMDIFLSALAALVIVVLQGLLIRAIVLWIAKRNNYTDKTMPVKYHTWLLAVYCGLLAVEVFILQHI
jgi:hypothetical protein